MYENRPSGANFSPTLPAPTPDELGFQTHGMVEAVPGLEASRVTKNEYLTWQLEAIRAVAADTETRQAALKDIKTYAESEVVEASVHDPTYGNHVAAREEANFAHDVIAAYASGPASLRAVLTRAGRSGGLQASIYEAGDLAGQKCYANLRTSSVGSPYAGLVGTAINASVRLAQERWAQEHGSKRYTPANQPPAEQVVSTPSDPNMFLPDQGLDALRAHLAQIAPDLPEPARLGMWIQAKQAELQPLDLGNEVRGIEKTPFVNPAFPDVVIKSYSGNFATSQGYLDDPQAFAVAQTYIPDSLATTVFAEIPSRDAPVRYEVQERLSGVRYKHVVESEALGALYKLQSQNPTLADYIGREPDRWRDFRRDILQAKLGDEQWQRTRQSVRHLVRGLQGLEHSTYRLRDLDFFITPNGEVKVFDFNIVDIRNPRLRYDRATDWKYGPELARMFELDT